MNHKLPFDKRRQSRKVENRQLRPRMQSLPGGYSADVLRGQRPFMPTAKRFICEVKWGPRKLQNPLCPLCPLNSGKALVRGFVFTQAAQSQGLLGLLGNAWCTFKPVGGLVCGDCTSTASAGCQLEHSTDGHSYQGAQCSLVLKRQRHSWGESVSGVSLT